MNKAVCQHIGLALFAAGVVTLISIFINQPLFWIAVWAIITGIIVYIVSHYWNLETIKSWFPILQFFRSSNIITIRIEKKLKQTEYGINFRRDMKSNPESFIFPSIQNISVSPIKYGQNYIDVRCYFFSALPYYLELSKVSVRLILNGTTSKSQPILEDGVFPKKLEKVSLALYAEHPNDKPALRIYLNKMRRKEILRYAQQHKSFEVCLQLNGEDKKGKKYHLETEQRTTLFLNA